MTASDRRQFRRSIILGLLLTTTVVGLDSAHWLDWMENWLYSMRALYCQHFSPRPTDTLIHVDIDDTALEEKIGKWPWPRDVEAKIVDELRLAGARALALDIMFPHPTRTPGVQPGASDATSATTLPTPGAPGISEQVDDPDADLAAALRRFGRVTLAVSLDFVQPAPPTARGKALVELLEGNLELTREEADARLGPSNSSSSADDEFFLALHQAAARRVAGENPSSMSAFGQIRDKLLPTLSRYHNSVPERVLETETWRFVALRAMSRMMPPVPAGAPPLRLAVGERPPLPQLSEATWGIGSADNIADRRDGVVRWLPLMIEDHGRMVPQLGLSLACAFVGCEVKDLRLAANSITIPRSDAPPIVIPTWTTQSADGAAVGAMIDIPLAGNRDWETMYDYPAHITRAQHLPIGAVWEVVEMRQRLRANNHSADLALGPMLAAFNPDQADLLKARPLDPDDSSARLQLVHSMIDNTDVKKIVADYQALSPEARQADPNHAAFDEILGIWEQLPALVRQTQLLSQQLAQGQGALASQLGGKAVIVGWTATGNVDFTPTALHARSPGVVVHGAIFNGIMTQWLLKRSSRGVSFLIAAIFGLLMTVVVALTSPWKALSAMLLLLAAYLLINGELLYDYNHRIVGIAGPVVAGLVVWSCLTAARFIAEAAEHSRIRQRFRAYKDPGLVNYIIAHPEIARLQGEVRVMTVAFTDLAGFTAMSEELRERVVRILGRYMTRMVPIIRKYRGLINSFMGDGIMFSYGAPIENPNHAADAAMTILEMGEAMTALNAELRAEGNPQLHMRAGVNTGEVIVGDTGPEDASDYTCLGDVTNFAARLESANKATGTANLISANTVERLNGRFLLRPVARLQVAGRRQGVMTFELLAENDRATEAQKRLARMTGAIVDHFMAARFEQCIAAADELDREFGASKLTQLYRQRCAEYLAAPPVDFSGSIVLERK